MHLILATAVAVQPVNGLLLLVFDAACCLCCVRTSKKVDS